MELTWLLWLEGDRHKEAKNILREAIECYIEKHGIEPNRALVPKSFPKGVNYGSLIIEHRKNVLEEHLMLAFDDGITKMRQNSFPVADGCKSD